MRGLGFAFYGQGGDRSVGGVRGEVGEADAEAILDEGDIFSGGVEAGGFYFGLQAGQGDGFAGPEVDMHEERTVLAGEAGVVGAADLAYVGSINGVGVALCPLAHFVENADAFVGDGTVGVGPDI